MNDRADLRRSRAELPRYDFGETKYDAQPDGRLRGSCIENSITSTPSRRKAVISSNMTASDPPFRKKNLLANRTFSGLEPCIWFALRADRMKAPVTADAAG